MGMYFKEKRYLEKALALAADPPESTHSLGEALILCLSPASRNQTDNLCAKMQEHWPELTGEECFQLTRGNSIAGKVPLSEDVCKTIWECAQELLAEGKTIGSERAADGIRSTSTLWSHLLLESKVAGQLAGAAGLNPETAMKLAMLHDFGRTVTNTLEHGLRGFEILVDIGWDREAMGALTHSFFAGGRCANLEKHVQGFSVDDEGNPHYDESTEEDDVCVFLKNYTYNHYDIILNIADLMASTWAILPPAERVADVLTRRVFDPVNYWYFLTELTNKLWEVREWITGGGEKAPDFKIRADIYTSTEEIQAAFEDASSAFFSAYLTICEKIIV